MKRRDALLRLAAMAMWVGFVKPAHGRGDDLLPVKVRSLEIPDGPVRKNLSRPGAVAFDRDGGRIAAGGDSTGYVGVWDAESGRLVNHFLAMDRRIHRMALSPKGKRLVVAGPAQMLIVERPLGEAFRESGGMVRLWDVEASRLVAELRPPEPALALAFGEDESSVCMLGPPGVTRWDFVGGRSETWPFPGPAGEAGYRGVDAGMAAFDVPRGRVMAIARTPQVDDDWLACEIIAWDLASGRSRTLKLPDGQSSLGPLALGSKLAVGYHADRRRLAVLDPHDGSLALQTGTPPPLPAYCVWMAVSPDDSMIAAAGYDDPRVKVNGRARGEVPYAQVLNLKTGITSRSEPGPPGQVRALTFLPDGRVRLASSGLAKLLDKTGAPVSERLTVWEFTPPALP